MTIVWISLKVKLPIHCMLCRVPPAWGAMKHLQLKIPEALFKKSQMYGYLLDFDG